jgi:opacity protein-like surface antigen
MKEHVLAWLLFAAAVPFAAPAAAQGTGGFQFGFTGGVSIPTSNASDAFDTGYHGGLVLNYERPTLPLGLRVDGDYQHFSLKPDPQNSRGSAQIVDGNANLVVGLRIAIVKLYALGGVGIYNVKFSAEGAGFSLSSSQTEFGWNAGVGVAFVAGKLSIFVEGRYHEISLERITVEAAPPGGPATRATRSPYSSTPPAKFKFIPVSIGILF